MSFENYPSIQPGARNVKSAPPIVWSIAGSDASGGAGIQADVKALNALGVHACTIVTAVTAQNSQGVHAIEPVSARQIEAQLAALADDLPPAAIKIGMIGTADALEVVTRWVQRLKTPVVFDPVLVASGNSRPLHDASYDLTALRSKLVPHVNMITPNLPEAERLTGRSIRGPDEVRAAADALLQAGVKCVLMKGGHAGGSVSRDFWTNGKQTAWLVSPRLDTRHTHGGGCTLSSAIAAGRALGLGGLDASVLAKAYVNQGLRLAVPIGGGRGPVAHSGWPADPADMPWITSDACDRSDESDRLRFPDPGLLGLYPIVDRADWIERLLPLGVDMIQLRVKDLQGSELEKEIQRGVAIAQRHGARLYVNDHWRLALRFGAYGVHLGQDDLPGVDLAALHGAGLRLGLSTHGLAEIARALAVFPSYLAIGTLFESPSKTFAHKPLGLDVFRKLRPLAPVPVVAIGGITLERAAEVRAAGAEGLAVISDLVRTTDLPARVAAWLRACPPAASMHNVPP
jgi:hydroxymethylpyrimidine kinase/phosphomethylpyrimidine kinase/thiamine-phosphate diphosphorylase